MGLREAAAVAAARGKRRAGKDHTGGRSNNMSTTTAGVLSCTVTTNSITITFSEAVNSSTIKPGNITVFVPPAIRQPTPLDATWTVSPATGNTLTATLITSSTPFS